MKSSGWAAISAPSFKSHTSRRVGRSSAPAGSPAADTPSTARNRAAKRRRDMAPPDAAPDGGGAALWRRPRTCVIQRVTRGKIFRGNREIRNRRSMLRSGLFASALALVLLPAAALAAGETEFLAGQTKACAKCALPKVSLKRRDLGGADLSGANLAGAVFHRSKLLGTNFAGADLTGTNLNKTDLKNAVLTNVKGAGAMFYESDLSVANFTGADLTEGKLGKARMVRPILDRAKLTEAILTGARLDN